MSSESCSILVVEDDRRVASSLVQGLSESGYAVQQAGTVDAALKRLAGTRFDLILLDLGLGGRDGLEVLRELRGRQDATPVLVLTARDALPDRVQGLDAGADDYLVKPFAFPELLARLRALLRRTQPAEPTRLRLADLEVDIVSRNVQRGGRPINLTVREFDMLAYLMRNGGQTVTRDMLARDVWRETARVTPLDNVIDVHLSHLREKIDREAAVKLLHTIRGVGFILEPRP